MTIDVRDALLGEGEVRVTVRVVVAAVLVLALGVLAIEVLVDAAPEPGAELVADFDGPDGPLDEAAGELAWTAPGWVVGAGAARTTTGEGDEPVVAIAALDAPPSVVGATVVEAPAGSALLFRYLDGDNHWSLVPVARFGTWEVRSVVGGVSTRHALAELSATAPGTRIEAHVSTDEIHVFVEGRSVATVESDLLAAATGVGLRGVSGTAWDRLIIAEG